MSCRLTTACSWVKFSVRRNALVSSVFPQSLSLILLGRGMTLPRSLILSLNCSAKYFLPSSVFLLEPEIWD